MRGRACLSWQIRLGFICIVGFPCGILDLALPLGTQNIRRRQWFVCRGCCHQKKRGIPSADDSAAAIPGRLPPFPRQVHLSISPRPSPCSSQSHAPRSRSQTRALSTSPEGFAAVTNAKDYGTNCLLEITRAQILQGVSVEVADPHQLHATQWELRPQ